MTKPQTTPTLAAKFGRIVGTIVGSAIGFYIAMHLRIGWTP